MNSSSKINAMTLVQAAKLGVEACHTNVATQKIDGFTLGNFGMV